MSALSDYAENKVLDVLGANATFTAPSNVYLGLSTGSLGRRQQRHRADRQQLQPRFGFLWRRSQRHHVKRRGDRVCSSNRIVGQREPLGPLRRRIVGQSAC